MTNMDIIKGRLKAIANMVSPGNVVADIGCDHAYLSIYLVKNNICPKVIACDINAGPLKIAANNIRQWGCEDKIDVRLGNGLEPVKANEVSSVVIAGMGGGLITDIIRNGNNVLAGAKEIIIGAQSEISAVRHFLEDNGYSIVSEDMVIDEGKFYPIIKAVHGKMNLQKEIYYRYGKILIKEDNPVLKEYLIRQKAHYAKLLSHIGSEGESAGARQRLDELAFELKLCENALISMNEQDVKYSDRTIE